MFMKTKKFILLIMTLLCIVGGTMSVFADETTNQIETTTQSQQETPAESVVVGGNTYVLDTKINGKNIKVEDTIIINNHMYYKIKNTMDIFSEEFAKVLIIILVILLIVFLVVLVRN